MDYKLMAKRLINRYGPKACIKLFKDLQSTDVESIVSNISNINFLKQVKNELNEARMSKKVKNHIRHMLDRGICKLAV